MMVEMEEIQNILGTKTHEGQHLEFKRSGAHLSKDFWETYSAFANTNGGLILFGVAEDDNKDPVVSGIQNPEEQRAELFSTLANPEKVNQNVLRESDVQIFSVEGKSVMAVYVPEASAAKKPIFLNRNLASTFIRKHEIDCKASQEELGALIRNRVEDLDSELLDGYTEDDLDLQSVASYRACLAERYPRRNFDGMSVLDFLKSIGVFQYDHRDQRKLKLTLGGLLFFGKYNAIISRLPHYHVDFFDRRGDDERWTDRVCSGDLAFPDMNLFNYYTVVLAKLLGSIKRPFKIDSQMVRKSYADLDVAIRETFVNMIVHADYLSDASVLAAEIHEPYYIFTNPGIMKVPPQGFFMNAQSRPRNTILVQLFTQMGAAERAGSGSQKIRDVIVKNDFKVPEIQSTLEKTVFKLWTVNVIDVMPGLGEVERSVYKLLDDHSDGLMSANQIKEQLPQYSGPRIMRALRYLADQELIVKKGGNRNREYGRAITVIEFLRRWEDANRDLKRMFQ